MAEESTTTQKPYCLITGAAGGLASLIASRLQDRYEIVGVDPRPLPDGKEFPGEFRQVHYSHRKMADIFRSRPFSVLLHMGRIPIATRTASRMERYAVNVLGTHSLLEMALKYNVGRIIVMSTFHVYGAQPTNPVHIGEEAPLRASQTFPELADAVEFDHMAKSFMYQYRRVKTIILRPVNVVGPELQNHITRLLRSKWCPLLLGYDPMLQFIHQDDYARAVETCLEATRSGVYNVAGEGAVPYSETIRLAGAKAIPLPHPLVYPAVGVGSRLGLSFPTYLIDYFRYATVVADNAFRNDFGFRPMVTTHDALDELSRLPRAEGMFAKL